MDQDYRFQLQSELRRRQVVNPRFSMRSFARTLGLSPAFLSKLLRGQKHVSTRTALSISDRLGYSDAETAQFCRLVQLTEIRDEAVRGKLSAEDAESAVARHDFVPLSLDAFQVVADWYHYAILELMECRDARSEPAWIARRLGISTDDAARAVERLLRMGLLKQQRGRLVKTERFIATPTDRPSEAIRAFHAQMLTLARASLEERTVEERDVTGITLAIDPDKLPLAKEEIRKFRRRMARLLDSGKASEVYQLGIQLFPLTRRAAGAALLLAFSAVSARAGGSEVGNGGGLAEKNLVFAYLNLSSTIDLCLATTDCRVGREEAEVLRRIRFNLPGEYAVADQIRFASERAQPGFFLIDGQIRIARTGDAVGSPIYVNVDLLYNDAQQAIGIPLATCILIHELGHHHGIRDHTWLDLLGSKTQALLLSRMQEAQLNQWNVSLDPLSVLALEYGSPSRFDELLVSYRGELVNLSSLVREKARCFPRETDLPVTGLNLSNLHWKHGEFRYPLDPLRRVFEQPLVAWYTATCGGWVDDGAITLTLIFESDAEGMRLVPEATEYRQMSCVGSIECFP